MSQSEERTYYARRAADELVLGEDAASAKAAAAHYELALRYSILSKGETLEVEQVSPVRSRQAA